MALCEMCGKEARVIEADVEGVELSVCPNCLKHGVVRNKPPTTTKSFSFGSRSSESNEPNFKLVNNFSTLLQSAREAKGMKQEEFAKFLNEKASLVSKWESGTLRPRVEIARKLERLLGIKLVEKDVVKKVELASKKKEDGFTLGDFIKIRTRK